MADINKFTTKEVLNKVLLDSSGNSVAANSHTSQEALNAVLDTSNNRLNVSLGGSNTISGDVTITGDLTVQGNGSGTYDEIIEGNLQVGNSSTADSTIIIESSSSGDPKLQFTSTANRIGIMDFVEAGTVQGSIVYDHNGDNLKFATGSTNRTARFTVNETSSHFTSNLGIGNTSPYSPLHVKSSAEGSVGGLEGTDGTFIPQVVIEGSGTTAAKMSPTLALFNSSTGADGDTLGSIMFMGGDDGTQPPTTPANASVYAGILAKITDETNSSNDGELHFLATKGNDNTNTAMSIVGSDVGIGISSPESLLHIQSDTTAQMQLHNTSSGNAPKLLFDGLVGANADFVLGSVRASWDTHTNIVSEIRFESGVDTANKDDGQITFWTSSASSTVAERLRIDEVGNVGINCDHPSVPLEVELSGDTGTYFEGGGSGNDASDLRHLTMTASTTSSAGDTHTLNAESGSGVLKFATSGTDRMTINSTGTTISGTATVTGALIDLRASANTDSEIIFREGSTAKAMIFNDASTNSLSLSDGGGTLSSVVNINSSNVGIGIVPESSQKLQVKTASDINFSVSAVGSALRINAVNDAADATAPLEMNSSTTKFLSKVGINVTPIGTLDVNISTDARGSFSSNIGEIGSGVFALQVTNAVGDALKPMGIRAEDIRLVTGSATRLKLDDNSRISLSNNDGGGTGGDSSTTGNTLLGYAIGDMDTNSFNNTLIGHKVAGGGTHDDMRNNVAVGTLALFDITSGDSNVAIGKSSATNINSGGNNTIIGVSAGANTVALTTGSDNTLVGSLSDVSASGASNQTVLGKGAKGVGDNTAIIGNSSTTDVYMGDNGTAWSQTSDGRLKENVKEWNKGLDEINSLRVVEFNFKKDNPFNYNSEKKRQGIIAQEAKEILPEMIKDDSKWLSANTEPMLWALVKAVQELSAKVTELENK